MRDIYASSPIDLDRIRADLMVERERVRHLEAMVRLAENIYGASSARKSEDEEP